MSLFSFFGMARAAELKVGDAVPKLTVKDSAGQPINFDALSNSGYTLVYFYPKADTPGCTKQGCNLRDDYSELTARGVHVVGVSHDSAAAQQAFIAKYHFQFPMVPDPEKKVIDAFGVSTIPVAGFAKRESFLLKDGKIVWRDLSANPSTQSADVLKAITALEKK